MSDSDLFKPIKHTAKKTVRKAKQYPVQPPDAAAMLTELLLLSPGPVALTNAENRILYVNQAFVDCWGYQEDNVPLGCSLVTLLVKGQITDNTAGSFLTELGLQIGSQRGQGVHADGSFFPLDITVRKISNQFVQQAGERQLKQTANAAASELALVFFFRDLTEQIKLEQQRQQVEQAVERIQHMSFLASLFGGIGHEINQPLNAIKVASDIVLFWQREGKPLAAEKVLEYMKTISVQAERAGDIVHHVRELLKNNSGQARGNCRINDAIIRVLTLISQQLSSHDIKLETELTKDMDYVALPCVQMEQIIINLLANARDALDEYAERNFKLIRVSTALENNKVVLRVADNGPGIKAELQTRIFEPFFSTKRRFALGLGLPLVCSLLNAVHGEIEVTNGREGGAIFTICLPAALLAKNGPSV